MLAKKLMGSNYGLGTVFAFTKGHLPPGHRAVARPGTTPPAPPRTCRSRGRAACRAAAGSGPGPVKGEAHQTCEQRRSVSRGGLNRIGFTRWHAWRGLKPAGSRAPSASHGIVGPGEEGVSFQAAHSAGDFYRMEWQRTFNQTAGTFPLPPMASYRRGPVEQGPGIGPSALGEATLDQARLETGALYPPQPAGI